MNFKEGDIVRIKEACAGTIKGRLYELRRGTEGGNDADGLYAWKSADDGKDLMGGLGCCCQEKWELVKDKQNKKTNETKTKNRTIPLRHACVREGAGDGRES